MFETVVNGGQPGIILEIAVQPTVQQAIFVESQNLRNASRLHTAGVGVMVEEVNIVLSHSCCGFVVLEAQGFAWMALNVAGVDVG